METAILTGIALLSIRYAAAYIRKRRIRIRKQRKRELQRFDEAYKLRFYKAMQAIEDWRKSEPPRHSRQNIICKDPRFAAAWK